MTDNIALDTVIGLVFIYLLYSLFATVLAEIIAVNIDLKARNLKEAIDRMLNDEQEQGGFAGWLTRLWDSFWLLKNPRNVMVDNFYGHPEIKYLGSTGIFRNPSSFKDASFSKTVVFILSGEGAPDREKIEQQLIKHCLQSEEVQTGRLVFGRETAKYVKSLWDE